MEIVGIESDGGVHTIDVWHSKRRDCWVVERRDMDGSVMGLSVECMDEIEAAACVGEWLRAHDETHLVWRGAKERQAGVRPHPLAA